MATYALTVSTNALGLGVISGAVVVIERKRTLVTDIYPTSSLYTKKLTTDVSGIVIVQLGADDGTVFHEIKIFDASGVLVYKNTIQMPPQAANIEGLPLNDIITESAQQAIQAKEDTEQLKQDVTQLKSDTLTLKNAAQTSATNASNSANSAAEDATTASNSASAALTSATIASNAQIGAEAARDAAIIGSGVYVDEPTGRAAVADGVAFKVQGSGDVAAYEYRRVNSSSSTLIATYPAASVVVQSKADLDTIKQAFDITPPKNKYNPDLAEDGFLYNYVGGLKGAFANAIISGHVPVQEGNTYTFSQPSPEKGFFPHLYFWDMSGTYLGMDALLSTNPVIPGIGLTASSAGSTGGYRVLTFTIPIGSGIAYVGTQMLYNYATHSPTDFNRIRNATQLEIGATATVFEAYATVPTVFVKDEHLPDTVQRSLSVLPLIDAFEVLPQRNLYNKQNAVDGQIISYETGLNVAFATGISLGYVPVEAGKTYTVSMGDPLGFHNQHAIYCRNSSGAFLGIDHTIGGTPGMASPPTGITWVGNSQVTFTIPVGSDIAYIGLMTNYSTHLTDDFTRVIDTVQVEEGVAATEYQRYAPYGEAVFKKSATDAPLVSTSAAPSMIKKVGNDIYIRSSFDSTYDLIQKVTLATDVAFTNNTVNVQGARKALKTVTDNDVAWGHASSIMLASQGDSSAPIKYNGTYIGGNHGAFVVKEITATGHGKTVVDVGSEWVDGLPRKWYLMRVVDANKLWFISENLSVAPAWSFSSTLTGSTLTHSAGATNTGAITVVSSVSTQLWPALQSQTKKIMLDGITEVTADGTYLCTTLDIVNSYTIPNVAAVLAYVRSRVGSATQPSFIDSSIAPDVSRCITYRYAENGSCTIIDSVRNYNQLTLDYFGGTQAEALEYTGKQLWQYIPRMTPIVGTVKTWDFQSQENISGTFETLTIDSSKFTDVNNPPDRMAQIVKTSGVSEFGLMIGFSPVRSVGLPATRKTLISESCFISALRKQYPKALNGGGSAFTSNILPVNSVYDIVAYRAYWSAETCPEATSFIWFRDGKNIIVIADFHQNVTCSKLPLPTYFSGLDVTVIDKTPTLTLHGSGVLSSDGLLVSVTSGYGYIVLKLS